MRGVLKRAAALMSVMLLIAVSNAVVITKVGIEPSTAFTDTPLRCYATAESIQSNYSEISFTWYLNSQRVSNWDEFVGAANNSTAYTSISIPLESLAEGDNWTCSVNAYDGFYHSSWVNSTAAYIHRGCGTLNEDAVLTASPESNGTCFTIGNDGITLDCGNYNITGIGDSASYGVDAESKNNVSIKNCIITDYGAGIMLNSSSGSVIYGNALSGNNVGLFVSSSKNNSILLNSIDENQNMGLMMNSSDENVVSRNSFKNNSGYGISLENSTLNIIGGNEVYQNKLNGILLSSDYNNVTGNVVFGNELSGIYLGQSSGNGVYNNSVLSNSLAGILLYLSDSNDVAGNSIRGNNNGLTAESSQNNSITSNAVLDNNIGLLLNLSQGFITKNTLSGNAYLGLELVSSENSIINGNGINSSPIGLYLLSSSNNSVSDDAVSSSDIGIYLNSVSDGNSISSSYLLSNSVGLEFGFSYNNTVANSTIDSEKEDVHSEVYSNNSILNSSFNISKVYADASSDIIIQKYFEVRSLVNDVASAGVEVNLSDAGSNLVSSQLSDANGTTRHIVSEFALKNSSLSDYNPYTISASYNNVTVSKSVNVTSSGNETVSIQYVAEKKKPPVTANSTPPQPEAPISPNISEAVYIIIGVLIANIILIFVIFKSSLFGKKKEY